MVHPKRKRQLSFEQLDSRIAMNSDMDPFASFAFASPQNGEFAGRLELRSITFVTSVPVFAVVQHAVALRPLNPPPPPSHGLEKVRVKVNTEMRAPAEGEYSQNSSIIPQSQTDLSSGRKLTGSEAAASSSLDATRSTFGLPNSRIDGLRSEVLNQTPTVSVSSPREPVALNLTRGSSPAPLVDVSPAKAAVEGVLSTRQQAVLQSQSGLIREPIASTSTPVLQPKSLESAKSSEATDSTENGMLTFSMRDKADRSTENGSFGGLHRRNGYRTLSDLQLLQMAEADRLRTEMAGTSKRLPTPRGMIEIDDNIACNSQKLARSIVSRASHNTFEILQLFIGSTNMVQGADELASQVSNASRMIGIDSQGLESTELATKEDSILALAVGVVFAMTFRQSQVQNSIGKLSKVVKRCTK